MDVNAVRRLMRRQIARAKSQNEWAREIGENPAAVSMMLSVRAPSTRVLDALGLERAPMAYRLKVAKPARGAKGKNDG